MLASTPGPAIRNISRQANERERERERESEREGGRERGDKWRTQLVWRVEDTFC